MRFVCLLACARGKKVPSRNRTCAGKRNGFLLPQTDALPLSHRALCIGLASCSFLSLIIARHGYMNIEATTWSSSIRGASSLLIGGLLPHAGSSPAARISRTTAHEVACGACFVCLLARAPRRPSLRSTNLSQAHGSTQQRALHHEREACNDVIQRTASQSTRVAVLRDRAISQVKEEQWRLANVVCERAEAKELRASPRLVNLIG